MGSVTTAVCNSFKTELLKGYHDLHGSSTIKIALIKDSPSGTYNKTTTNYTSVTGNSDEVSASGTNYSTGGYVLTNVAVSIASDTALVDFDDVVISSASFSADGAIIYESEARGETGSTETGKAIAVISFGSTQTSTNGTFTISIPSAGASTAIIRIA
tara:strand:- start:308 stop:781 length:474 start_codon:yes stop_codon:yes gene_type:complete